MTDDTIVSIKYIEWIFYETYFQDRWSMDYTKRVRNIIRNEAIECWTVHQVLNEIKKTVYPRTVITFGYIEEVISDFKKKMLEYANYTEFNRNLFWIASERTDDILDLIKAMH